MKIKSTVVSVCQQASAHYARFSAAKRVFSLPCLILFFCVLFSGKPMAQTITTVAGKLKLSCGAAPCGDGGLAKDAQLYSPSGIAVDQMGNIYIAEFSNHVVRKVDIATGIITTFAGQQRSGCQSAPCGDGGLAKDASLNGPRGVSFDAAGNLYIADFTNHVIRKVDKTTGIITTVAGTMKSSCSAAPCGNGGPATSAHLNSPIRVAFDSKGDMFIADYGNHAIRKVDKATGTITTYAGTLKTSCAVAPCGDGGAATSGLFNGPSSLAFDANDHLYVVEYGNHTVRKINKTTGIITTYAGTMKSSCAVSPCGDGGLATANEARLTSPFSLTVGPDNNLYIADASNAAIRKVDMATNIISTVAGIVKSSCGVLPCGEGGPATSAQLSNPFDVKFSPDGKIMYVLEYSNQVLRQVSAGITAPVRMTEISGVHRGAWVDIAWTALGEENVSRYEVERSADGTSFLKIGAVTAGSNGRPQLNYTLQDAAPLQGFNYYRVKSVDRDGQAGYSKVVMVGPRQHVSKLAVSPNPLNGKLVRIQFTSARAGQMVELVLFNNAGQRVMSKPVVGSGQLQQVTMDLPAGLPRGLYTLYAGTSTEEIGSERVVVQ